MEIAIHSPEGKASGKSVELADAAFGVRFNEPLVHQVVNAYLAGARAGTSAQKNRSAVSGGGRKPWRQKGTGRARAGTNRSPIWRGGGVTFPSASRDYSQKVNRKAYRGAMKSIFSELIRQDRLVVVDDFSMDEIKTAALVKRLESFGTEDVLIVNLESSENLSLSSRNLRGVEVLVAAEVNPLSLLGHEKVIVSEGALKSIEAQLQ